MAKDRNAASPNPGPIGRKRTREASSPAGSSKRRLDASSEAPRLYSREGSPPKNVHFGRNLIQGPTVVDLDRRSQSPSRSALHRPGFDNDAADAQLLAEHCEAQTGRGLRMKTQSLCTEAGLRPNVLRYNIDSSGTGETLKKSTRARKSAAASQDRLAQSARDEQFHGFEYQSEELSEGSDDAARAYGPHDVSGTDDPCTIEIGRGDEWVCEQMTYLTSMVRHFAEGFPAVSTHRLHDVLDQLLKRDNDHLIRYIGCLAMGGKAGVHGWHTLLSDITCRQALVSGIVGRALKEKVFGELLFGAPKKIAEMLNRMEQEQAQRDGFYRTKKRSEVLAKIRAKWAWSSSVQEAEARLTMQLERMLLPLWNQGSSATTWKNSHRRDELARIVALAADLSHNMREDKDVVYYWPPTFKDEEFEPARMECFNLYNMIHDSPYDKKSVNGIERAVLRAGHQHESEAIVRVVCFPGLVAYRQGGGELAQQQLAEESRDQDHAPPDVRYQRKRLSSRGPGELTGNEGFRTKVICKSVVLLQWGKQRLLTKEAGTSAHLDAKAAGNEQKYEDDYKGFVELYDLFLQKFPEPAPDASKALSQQPLRDEPQSGPSWSDVFRDALWRARSRSPSADHVSSGVSDAAADVHLPEIRRGGAIRSISRGKKKSSS